MAGTGRTSRRNRRVGALAGAAALTAFTAVAGLGTAAPSWAAAPAGHAGSATATPIKHVVVLFDENISFDHYFATYPKAANSDGTTFHPSRHTPRDIDNLRTAGLLKKNPNQYLPKRLTPQQAMTCDQNHDYGPEQYAYNGGKADKFVENTDSGKCSGSLFGEPGLVMDYYDGNTVTALWNYAQHYALNDRSFGTTYGPSTPGAINLVSGQTHGIISTDPASGSEHPRQTDKPDPYTVLSPDAKGVGTLVNDPDPAYDDCSGHDRTSKDTLGALQGRNIGDLLNSRHVSWGWFQGGFRPSTPWDGKQDHFAKCGGTTHTNVGGAQVADYSPHHSPFQYYRSTSNPHHLPPKSVREIGHAGPANHNYDLTDFDASLKAGMLPAVSFVKAPAYQDGHAGYSDPTDEQHFLVRQINKIQRSPQWKNTAIVVAYDDSDGWYDHAFAKPLNGSKDSTPGSNHKATDGPACQAGPAPAGGYADRCGPGSRQPLLVISPYSKVNAVDHTPTEQTSVLKFIEDNWHTGRLGDASFDERAGSLAGMFDFRHPNGKQVLLNKDGSVKSVGKIRPVAPVAASIDRGAAAPNLSETADSVPTLPIGIAAGALAVGATGTLLAVRRRRTRHTAA
ncbi:phospholipase C [Streptomyces natalensis]|uniref:Phospholipase C n=1 Tax=Streptomyces natalensis ATCC 27448 TaxID=1240678 RepID=A0A0D7CJX8_9ACTN|nr:alkaline phosphatase family protein [Streptomyces natalensis]KIZ16170.1 phospholipase C [Streptomyces natalensis ATCC 27448]